MLRSQNFEPNCLVRRSSPEGEDVDVSLWTNHRVMEWLRAVDLAEYAPNLRGSGQSATFLHPFSRTFLVKWLCQWDDKEEISFGALT